MAVDLQLDEAGKFVEIGLTGKLVREDYERFVPVLEERIKQHGKIRLVVEMHDFHGWSAAALWEDLKFDVKHFSDIERLAIVGENRWQQGMAAFCRPFTMAKIRYFDQTKIEEARAWIREA